MPPAVTAVITTSSRKAVTLAMVRSVSFVFRRGGSGSGTEPPHHRLGDLLFNMRFHGFHVRIPFSSLYPWPQTTFKYRGSAGLISSFSRRWRMWTATVFSLPKGASFHTFR